LQIQVKRLTNEKDMSTSSQPNFLILALASILRHTTTMDTPANAQTSRSKCGPKLFDEDPSEADITAWHAAVDSGVGSSVDLNTILNVIGDLRRLIRLSGILNQAQALIGQDKEIQ
jgi:hypothetical protein